MKKGFLASLEAKFEIEKYCDAPGTEGISMREVEISMDEDDRLWIF